MITFQKQKQKPSVHDGFCFLLLTITLDASALRE